MRDQRCLCCEFIVFCCFSSMWDSVTHPDQFNLRQHFSEFAPPTIILTYLLSKCDYWRYYKNVSSFRTMSCSPQSYTTTTLAATAKTQVNVRSRHHWLLRRTSPIAIKNRWTDQQPPTRISWGSGHIRGMCVSEWGILWYIVTIVFMLDILPFSVSIAKIDVDWYLIPP
jgi:hypothetical protein